MIDKLIIEAITMFFFLDGKFAIKTNGFLSNDKRWFNWLLLIDLKLIKYTIKRLIKIDKNRRQSGLHQFANYSFDE